MGADSIGLLHAIAN